MKRFKHILKSGVLTLSLSTLIACNGLTPSATGLTDADIEIPKALLELSTTVSEQSYTYAPVITFLRCSADKSSIPNLKLSATGLRDALLAAYLSGDATKAIETLRSSILSARALNIDPAINTGCDLKTSEIKTTPEAVESMSSTPEFPSTTTPATDKIRIEAETATKTGGSTRFPDKETRGGGEKVMMFSGGDAGGQATLKLPAIKGNFNIKINWLNCPDSPEMALKIGTLAVTLPDRKDNTGCKLKIRDLGEHTLDISEGDPLVMTVKGTITGKTNAWIALDYFELTPQ